jgi:hypothetical protein
MLITAGAAIILEKKARTISLVLGGVLLLMLVFGQVPYEFMVIPYKKTHLGVWDNALKGLALAGGAFVVAGSFPEERKNGQSKALFIRLLAKLIPFGGIFFCITMTSFGMAHFLYLQHVAAMVPGWMPDHIFWTYFAGVALIGSGTAIILKIRQKRIATLLGAMIFIWFIFLHIPDAIAYPLAAKGNEITSALSALAFSGIAFAIAGAAPGKETVG